MQQVLRSPNGLLSVSNPGNMRLLFIAPYAPNGPDYEPSHYTDDGTYPAYYHQTYKRLKRLGFQVESTSKPYSVVHAGGIVDYVFSLHNRMPIRNSEVFISAYCEYLNIPYLGAGPNIRAVAEDKFVSKMVAKSLDIPVPAGVVYHNGVTSLEVPPPFGGPYFIKDRFGAGSEGITTDNVQQEWHNAKGVVEALWRDGTDALVEEFVEGIDVTVPVVGDDTPLILGLFHPPSDKAGNILTEDLKLDDPLGYRFYDADDDASDLINNDVMKLWCSLGEIDYLRLDYRLNPETGHRKFLEFNVCCYLGQHGPFGMAAGKMGIPFDALVQHIVSFSLLRQGRWRKDRQRIL
jgi:D-alanine-D-alanine ligase